MIRPEMHVSRCSNCAGSGIRSSLRARFHCPLCKGSGSFALRPGEGYSPRYVRPPLPRLGAAADGGLLAEREARRCALCGGSGSFCSMTCCDCDGRGYLAREGGES